MTRLTPMTDDDRARVAAAVAAAEGTTSGEIVTVIAARSDDYADVAMAWSALVALAALLVIAWAPDFYLGIYDRITGDWAEHWSPGRLFGAAALVAALKFAATWFILLYRPLRVALVPAPIRHARVHARALAAFRMGAERRTSGRTGILIYLSLAERRAEILADETIATRVAADLWGEALAAMLAHLKAGRMAEGLIAAVERVGAVLATHLPREAGDINELPDRLIEV